MLLKSATQGLTVAQVYQDWARAGTHVDLDGVGHVQGVPSSGTNNPCLVNFAQECQPGAHRCSSLPRLG